MLYLVSTPIGNLQDITLRAIDVLKNCDYILCEDTRRSSILLKHLGISASLNSFHKFSESKSEERILEDLENGKEIALISDAGTPTISDPGERLVKACTKKNLPVTPIPGPCAATAALTSSGLSTQPFQFVGFIPKKPQSFLINLLEYGGTSVCYESPYRLIATLKSIEELDPKRKLVVARELTKKFEEFVRGTAAEILTHFQSHPLKGEIVLLISCKEDNEAWKCITPQEHVRYLEKTYSINKKEAIALAAKLRGVPKRDVYQDLI